MLEILIYSRQLSCNTVETLIFLRGKFKEVCAVGFPGEHSQSERKMAVT